jgi:methylated-DNA-protein-cysteine methyltransferase-like protein
MFTPPDPTAYFGLVWHIAKQIPEGKVSTYGQIASMIPPPPEVEPPLYARLGALWVGKAMNAVPQGSAIPWQRVINSQGKLSERPGARHQRELLEAEGVVFVKDKVDLKKYGWKGRETEAENTAQPALY